MSIVISHPSHSNMPIQFKDSMKSKVLAECSIEHALKCVLERDELIEALAAATETVFKYAQQNLSADLSKTDLNITQYNNLCDLLKRIKAGA